MALDLQPPGDRKRVKVYELKENDWFDRGTGFCTGRILDDEPRIFVESEDKPVRVLLETRISKDGGYQKQQDTLIVWTEPNQTDMALSFQEAEGCAVIWNFVNSVQQHLLSLAVADDALSDDLDSIHPVALPAPELANLPEIDHLMRAASLAQTSRDALSKCVIRDEYINKLLPLVTVAEDLESLPDLHRLCNIMKSLILLNDTTIIETVVTDNVILGVVGALEYDPEFPTHKANHRQYLSDKTRYKEVVPIRDPSIRRKIRFTWRLQYLKDVVLARILDDPTFSVLNSMIFYNQVDIVNHIQSDGPFLKELFQVFDPRSADAKRKEDAVQFLHQCASIAKNLQVPERATLFANLISHGLFAVIAFAIKHPNPSVRTTGIDILVALLDHDPIMMRSYMLKAVNEKKTPLTDTLIDLLHTEADLGVKNQLADAIKVLLDPQVPIQAAMARAGPEHAAKVRPHILSDAFVQNHFDESSKRLFAPLKRLEDQSTPHNLTFQAVALYSHLVDILTFFVRQHLYRCRNVIQNEGLAAHITQLLRVPQKHLKLTALKFFRTLLSLQDTFYQALMTHNDTFGLILDIVYETMPRDNLLNSACLELFEFIKREHIKPITLHVVGKYGDKLRNITYVDTFQGLILHYEQLQGYSEEADSTLYSQDDVTPVLKMPGSGRWQGVKDMDPAEEEYFNTSDDEDEQWQQGNQPTEPLISQVPNGAASPSVKSLVDYPDDDDEEDQDTDAMDTEKSEAQPEAKSKQPQPTESSTEDTITTTETPSTPTSQTIQTPPERLSEKRRREEEDDDELVKLTSGPKRRSSTSSSTGSAGFLRKKRSSSIGSVVVTDKGGQDTPAAGGGGGAKVAPKRIAINLSSSVKAAPAADVSPTNESNEVAQAPAATTTNDANETEKENKKNSESGEG
ncbi:component of IIS longevity pathway SMK-1-domain-containing protein [Aspergillus stella-maris]|uniref:component of IIS longevity pathway SMK-1-domain-containing protein n=1 Tax=Aspergillus stella-maris TaxID=1810926 RepID=UPI003CCCF2A3